MSVVVAALVPIFLIIVLGHALRRWRFLPDEFWAPAERITYYVTFPALLVYNLAGVDFAGLPVGPLAAVEAAATFAMAVAMLAARPAFARMKGASFSSMIQGAIRPNTYFGLAAAASLWGSPGVALTAVCIAAVVPLVNLLSVLAMVRFASGQPPSARGMLLPVLTNPLILACLLGIGLNFGGVALPAGVAETLRILGGAALPIGLLAVGAGLDLAAVRHAGRPVLVTALFKMVLLPLIAGLSVRALGLPPLAVGVAVLYASLPCSPSAYVLSRQMGGDSVLMASIISVHTLLAAVIVPLNLMLLAQL